MNNEFVGGMEMARKFWVYPGIRLTVTAEKLEFRLRYGLDRYWAPWVLERPQVKLIFRQPKGMTTYHSVGILVSSDVWWAFLTKRPGEVLDCLEVLGYPIDPDARRKRAWQTNRNAD